MVRPGRRFALRSDIPLIESVRECGRLTERSRCHRFFEQAADPADAHTERCVATVVEEVGKGLCLRQRLADRGEHPLGSDVPAA